LTEKGINETDLQINQALGILLDGKI